jgi:hypothetical protein
MGVLKAATKTRLDKYQARIQKLAQTYPWWIIGMADISMRREHLEKVRRKCLLKHAKGTLPELNPLKPWDIIFGEAAADDAYWSEHVEKKTLLLAAQLTTHSQAMDQGFGSLEEVENETQSDIPAAKRRNVGGSAAVGPPSGPATSKKGKKGKKGKKKKEKQRWHRQQWSTAAVARTTFGVGDPCGTAADQASENDDHRPGEQRQVARRSVSQGYRWRQSVLGIQSQGQRVCFTVPEQEIASLRMVQGSASRHRNRVLSKTTRLAALTSCQSDRPQG